MPLVYHGKVIVGSFHLSIGWYLFIFLTLKGISIVSLVIVLFETTELFALMMSLKKVKIPN